MDLSRKSILAVLLSALLIVTGGTLASARGQTHIAGEIVICVGATVTTITVDENGNPVGPPHICPDCVLHAFDAGVTPDTALGFDYVATSSLTPFATVPSARVVRIDVHSRGPPSVV